MRLVAGVLALTLFTPFVSLVRAEDAAPHPAAEATRNRVPLRVVRVMPESHQALLFDRVRATHVLAEVGAKLDGYSVDEIDDDEVILSRDGTQFVLAAPAPRRERAAARPAAKPSDSGADSAAPIDPYADGEIRSVRAPDADHPAAPASTSSSAGAPPSAAFDPQPGAGDIRVAHAPSAAAPSRAIEPGSDGVRVAQAPMEPEHAPAATAAPTSPTPTPVAVAAAPSVAPTAPSAAPTAPSAVPTAPSSVATAPSAAPTAPSAAPTAPYPAPTVAEIEAPAPSPVSGPPLTAPASEAPSPAPISVAMPPSSPPSPDARSLNAAMPDRPARGKQAAAAKAKPARRTAAGKQTDDALALADVLSGDRSSRSPRGPTVDARPAEPHPAPAAARPSEPRTAAPSADAILLSRGEVDRALGDFAKLTAAIHASFSDTGVRVDDVTTGTIFDRAGLKAGDTITAIDGARLRSLDDAANLYARASTARALTVQLVRDGKPLSLRVVIQ